MSGDGKTTLPHRIAILGAGEEGERLARLAPLAGVDVVALYDDDPAKWGKEVGGHIVRQPGDAIDIPLVVASHRTLGAALRYPGAIPFTKWQVDYPDLFPPHPFVEGWREDWEEHKEDYDWLMDELEDATSRDVLNAILYYRESVNPLAFDGLVSDDLYRPDFLPITDREVYIDAGAYKGDSVGAFIAQRQSALTAPDGRLFRRILAFEPDRENFLELLNNYDRVVCCYNVGLWGSTGQVGFGGGERAGAVGDGSTLINVVALDDVILPHEDITYLKMNIEGAEEEALWGARKTIRRWRPKLALSVYHRASHLWKIPRLVRSLHSDYKLYLRQHDGGCVESVLYAL